MKPRCSYGAGQPTQCQGVARWISMNGSGTPTRMIWCDKCHSDLRNMELRTGVTPHRRLTKKFLPALDRPWHWHREQEAAP